MRDLEQWRAANDEYLATALGWLRARLEQMASAKESSVIVAPEPVREATIEPRQETSNEARPAAAPGIRRQLLGRFFNSETRDQPLRALPPPIAETQAGASPPQSLAMPAAMIEAESADPPPALVLLAQRLGLSAFERYTLLLCAAMELDTSAGALCARAQQDPSKPFPTFALAMKLLDEPTWDVMSPERPLRYWRLVEISQPGAQPLIGSALKADERIVNYLKGLNYLDDRLTPLISPVDMEESILPESQGKVASAIARNLEVAETGAPLPAFQLLGSDSQSKLLIAHDAARRQSLVLYRLPGDQLPSQTADNETFVRLWRRESALLPIALYLDVSSLERGTGPQVAAIQRLMARGAGLMFVDTREPWPELGRESIAFEVAKPTSAEQRAVWAEVLGAENGDHPARLAGHFSFNAATIRGISARASAAAAGDPAKLGEALWRESLRHARPALDQLAQPVEPKARWDDLELPVTEKNLLRQIAEQVKSRSAVYDDWGFRERMNRGFGISVLFAGDSGTGKTMAAEVLASELGLLIYRIDLSAVVSKYIGETEKNLRKLFDAAEDGGAILFFDEADALFGKRSEVKDSHDRYANIEVNYLLQRIESFRGLAILASNMKSALDVAFLRRLRFIVNFPFPGPAERMAIWEKVFPAQTPTDALDFHRLARLNLTGGSIHNVALNAAFMAASAGTRVTMQLLLEGARAEFRKLEKPINEADFRWLESAAVKEGATA